MSVKTFCHPYWCNRIFNFLLLLPFLVVFYKELRSGGGIRVETLIIFGAMFVLLSYSYAYHGKLSKTIKTSEKGIKSLNYNNSIVEISWEEPMELIEERRFFFSWFRWFRLVTKDGRAISFLDKIRKFDELMDNIDHRAINLRKNKRRAWI